MAKRKTQEEFVSEMKEKFPNVKVCGTYINNLTKLDLCCTKHKYKWNTTTSLALKCGCPICSGAIKTTESYKEDLVNNQILNIIPIEEYKTAKDKIKHKCLKCNYEWDVTPNSILSGHTCPFCGKSNQIIIGKNDLSTIYPEVAKMLVNPDDGLKYGSQSSKKLDWICPNCSNIIKNKSIDKVVSRGLVCNCCSSGISIPNKFVANLLQEVGIDYIPEKRFIWSDNKRYDFYIPILDCICEVNGNQHYDDKRQFTSNMTVEKQQSNDIGKENLAKEQGITNYITIDARHSEFNWLKESILNSELSKILDLTKIDFYKCFMNCQKSDVIASIDMWNSGKNTREIATLLKIHPHTVITYLYRGNDLKLCNYRGIKERSKKVICLTTNEIFESPADASRQFNIKTSSQICSCCKGQHDYCGKHPETNEKLQWQYYDEYLNSKALSEIEGA